MADIIFDTPDPARVLGLSTSHWTGVVDFQKAKEGGIKFWIGKAGNGLLMGTKFFKENYKGAKDAGILVGAYTWLYPSSSYSPGTQARNYAKFLLDYPVDIPPCVDFEWTTPKNPNSGDLWGFVKPFEDTTQRKPMIYSARGYWGQYGSTSPDWAKYPLWQAEYNRGAYRAMAPWTVPDILQWTQIGKGTDYGVPVTGERACELNYWRGTHDELLTWVGKSTPQPVPVKRLLKAEADFTNSRVLLTYSDGSTELK